MLQNGWQLSARTGGNFRVERVATFPQNTHPEARIVADELSRTRKLEVQQLVDGVGLRAFSWVGRIELGQITVTVKPKISHAPFLDLLRYAYGLRQLSVTNDALYETKQGTFQDLIARQLASEVKELMARGLHRDYRRESAELSVPRGRIDFDPRSRHTPTLRPDFIVLSGNKTLSVLDAKYRDLWEHNLPREIWTARRCCRNCRRIGGYRRLGPGRSGRRAKSG